ncbi:hypothetical protein AX17_005185 [Amanita inopinata Kibby_2008]|nr:hypothetical protein AX17_005185 [Amanita inopinata Kibby_2008]
MKYLYKSVTIRGTMARNGKRCTSGVDCIETIMKKSISVRVKSLTIEDWESPHDSLSISFFQCLHYLLTRGHIFPSLTEFVFDWAMFANSAIARTGEESIFQFISRHHESLLSIVGAGEFTDTNESNVLRFPYPPGPYLMTALRSVETYGILLPHMLGIRYVKPLTDIDPVWVKTQHHPGVLPLSTVKIWWLLDCVHMTDDTTREDIMISILDVLEALSSVCKNTLSTLEIELEEDQLDLEIFEAVAKDFPNLRKLSLNVMRQRPIRDQIFIEDYMLCKTAEFLGKLKHLERFEYMKVELPLGDEPTANETIRYQEEPKSQWERVKDSFVQHCPQLKSIVYYALEPHMS